MSELQWLQLGAVGAGGILVVMVLDRVTKIVGFFRNGRRNGGNGHATPAWRTTELLTEILSTLRSIKNDLCRLHDRFGDLAERIRGPE
jgi:hypothetical protein